jgi:hypothetical protein
MGFFIVDKGLINWPFYPNLMPISKLAIGPKMTSALVYEEVSI